MTFLEAAIMVVRSKKHPMTETAITEVAIARGLIRPAGRTVGLQY